MNKIIKERITKVHEKRGQHDQKITLKYEK